MENNNIPIITIDYFEEVYIEHVINTLRISKDEFRAKLESIDSTSINKKADRFITTYLKNRTDKLTEDNWIAAKELYIQWKLFEGIEREEESRDKKETLIELLELFKNEVIELEDEEIESQKKVAKIIVHSRGV
ncbi:hypothetical protein [Fusobacterium mortiferum]|jgi:hypothetical protein|uniref:Uncharacterized protein n=1 Tax=Fusobacterium mortiferum ATCC 9817 TaxID=469616 RepID=A0ABM6TXP6_FUSMR|nr:hypothetical protein [Fusobacterium mortiferum]AVQ19200.1 hypothetical protein C4N19_08865 [Fusobacterium mortiferum ATCC 9817]EEO36404.1 hypothetical protein FMAG_01966 [Fusobacterium mortiferum ATCC 9817]DAQ92315.1 MAG TPA: hypothetical protein [Caudoviricetes sp.]